MPSPYMIAEPAVIPQEPRALDQWVIRDEQKRPINPATGKLASPTDSTTWSSFTTAAATGRPLGFVFTEDDPYVGIDLDHCRDPETGAIAPEAMAIIDRFATYAEVSPSGTGIHLIGRGVKPTRDCTMKTTWGKIECYDHGRYFTMTGNTLAGHDTIRNCQRELTTWHREVWPAEPERPKPPPPTFTTTSITNEQILEIAFRAQNGDSIRRLYGGDISGYSGSQTDSRFSSEADLALVSRLSFYTSDDEQLADLWRSSGLYRKKLDRSDYVNRTIAKARSGQSGAYSPGYASQTREPVHHDGVPTSATGSCPAQLVTAGQRITELEAQLATAEAGITVRDDTIARQAARIDQYSVTQTAIERILASSIEAGPKVTAIGLLMEGVDQQKRGKPAAAHGRHVPGVWIARRTGGTVNTANKHVKKLADAGLIERKVVKERVIEDTVDEDTGEIVPAGRTISRAYYPDQASALISTFSSYQRPDDAPKHGGKRTPYCTNHPDSSTTTTHVTRCDECRTVIDEHVTHRHPTEWKHQDGVSTTTVDSSKGNIKMVFPPATGSPLVARVRRVRPAEPPPSRDYRDEDAPTWIGGDR